MQHVETAGFRYGWAAAADLSTEQLIGNQLNRLLMCAGGSERLCLGDSDLSAFVSDMASHAHTQSS